MTPPHPLVQRFSTLLQATDGHSFRDLNKNGRLDIYEDPRQRVEARVEDLLRQMTLAEKAGLPFINGAAVKADGSLEPPAHAPRSPRPFRCAPGTGGRGESGGRILGVLWAAAPPTTPLPTPPPFAGEGAGGEV